MGQRTRSILFASHAGRIWVEPFQRDCRSGSPSGRDLYIGGRPWGLMAPGECRLVGSLVLGLNVEERTE